jgi:hypothetical protein
MVQPVYDLEASESRTSASLGCRSVEEQTT